MGLEAAELARWTRFAAKGGIGKCVALRDCVAESADDLMFLKDDEITVLYQLPDREGFYLGHCEGVVGRFNGADVQFLTKLKKPVMTKRSSVSASSVTGKSPTPTSGIKSPSPSHPPSRRSSSHADTAERRSSSSKARVLSSLSGPTTAHSTSDDEGLRRTPHMSRSSVSTAPDSVLNTPAVGSFSPALGGLEARKSEAFGTPSPRDPAFPVLEPDGLGISTTQPPTVSVSSHSEAEQNLASSPPQSPPQQPRYTSLAPSPLNLFPEGNTSPLRITKRSPVSPQSFSQQLKPPSPPPPITSAEIPDSSYSTLEDRKRFSTASQAQVGIGLSLLQDLANDMDSDEEGEEEERGRWAKDSTRFSQADAATPQDDYAAALSRVGQRDSLDASQESTVEGLGYAMSDDEDDQQENTVDQLPAELQEFPKPPTSLLSPAASPVSANFERERRPSLAPSAASTGSWEGASDIYDDYRYSRYSMMSKVSRFSTLSGANTPAAQTPPPVPESRPSVDSYFPPGRPRADSSNFSVRSRTDSTKSHPSGVDHLQPLVEDQQLQEGESTPATSQSKRTLAKTMLVDSDASVYSANSRFSGMSHQEGSGGFSALNALSTQPPPSVAPGAGLRPAPLNLTKQEPSPLLHTSWGSPVSSVGSPKSTMFTSVPPLVSESSMHENAMKSPTFGGFASAMRQRIEEDRVKSPNAELDKEKEERGRGEDMDGSAATEEGDMSRSSITSHGAGLGNRIVVEDEDELPSRILNSTLGSSVLHESPENSDAEDDANATKTEESAILPAAEAPASPMVPTHPPSTPPPEPSVQAASNPSSPGSPSPSHLRPSLAELREGGTVPVPGTNQRRSIFLPHPNAPKSPGLNVTQGPMYIAAQQQPQPPASSAGLQPPPSQPGLAQGQLLPQQHPSQPPYPQQQQPPPQRNLFGVIRMALSMPPPPNRPQTAPGRMAVPANFYRGPTIYGRTEEDLANAVGPVPIVWSVEPPPPPQRPPGAGAGGPPPGVGGVVGQRGVQMMPRPQQPQQLQGQEKPPQQLQQPQQRPPPARSMSMGPAPREGVGISGGAGAAGGSAGDKGAAGATAGGATGAGGSRGAPAGAGGGPVPPEVQRASGGVIPRANFFPKSPGLRPRSRSFSGFNTMTAEAPVPLQRSAEDSRLSAGDIKRSLTSSTSSLSPNPLSTTPTSKPGRGPSPLRPSPLSLSSTSSLKPIATSPALKSPSSPLAQSVIIPPQPSEPDAPAGATSTSPPQNAQSPPTSPSFGSMNARPMPQLRQVGSRSNLNDRVGSPPSSMARPTPLARGRQPSGDHGMTEPAVAHVGGSNGPGRTASLQAAPRPDLSSFAPKVVDSDAASIRSARSQLVSPPPSHQIGRQPSLRSKLSLPNLRRKPKQDDETSIILSPSTSTNPHMYDSELLQVQDMEFELVRPNLAHFQQAARTSEDSNILGRDNSFDIKPDSANSNTFLRAESPAMSVSSGGQLSEQRSPTIADSGPWIPEGVGPSGSASRLVTEAESASMDAHRQRELKWMSLMSSNPASQARKSKKVKKLLLEGVPSSVRYLVWSYLTDGKAKCVPGVYAQLCGRGNSKAKAMGVGGVGSREGLTERMERDIRACFQDQPHLQGQQGPVGVLLQAYLTMVPDVHYSMGLTLIVGQLLLLAPEEDAFWIFVSIMDTHIRSYFSASTTQMEVDAALFSRALESNDAPLARKLLVDMGIQPISMCQSWFSTLFVSTLPPDYLNRVWDVFLFEGIPFLLRVGLAVVVCCRRKLLDSTSEESVLHLLRHPPQAWLPATPDAFLSLAYSFKLKDDDVKKQRVKMEAQVKRQTQVPRITSVSTSISLPRT